MTKIYDIAEINSHLPTSTGLPQPRLGFAEEARFQQSGVTCSVVFNVHEGILQMKQLSSRTLGSIWSYNFPFEDLGRMQKRPSRHAGSPVSSCQGAGSGGDQISPGLCSRGSWVLQLLPSPTPPAPWNSCQQPCKCTPHFPLFLASLAPPLSVAYCKSLRFKTPLNFCIVSQSLSSKCPFPSRDKVTKTEGSASRQDINIVTSYFSL